MILASTSGTGSDVWYYTRDHLGSTRLITGANGTVLERSDYYPYGLRMEGGTQATGNRWRFAGKEEQSHIQSLAWLDFGARMYDPFLGRWTTQDPLTEKYPALSPYSYCASDPIDTIDPDGRSTRVRALEDGRFKVFGGEDDGDYNIYLYSQDVFGDFTVNCGSIGVTTSIFSFYNSDSEEWGGIIDIYDNSGKDFLNYIADAELPLFSYALHALPHGILDFNTLMGALANQIEAHIVVCLLV